MMLITPIRSFKKFLLIVSIFSHGAFVFSSPEAANGFPIENGIDTIDNKVTRIAKDLKGQNSATFSALDRGRKNLILEMENNPRQLGLDLPRTPVIRIGRTRIAKSLRNNKSATEQYEAIARLLEDYINDERPNLPNAEVPGRLGVFFTVEVVYALVQNFSATAQIRAYKNERDLTNGFWGPAAAAGNLTASFSLLSDKESTLVVSTLTEKVLMSLQDDDKQKKFITESKIFFDLQTGKVSYHHRYSLNNRTKMWSTASQP